MTSPAAQQAPEPSAGREPWPLGRMIWAGVAASVLVALVAAVVAGAAFHTLSAARHQVISVADPAAGRSGRRSNMGWSSWGRWSLIRRFGRAATGGFRWRWQGRRA